MNTGSTIKKLLSLLISGDAATLYYHLWLRIHRLDHKHVNRVQVTDGQPYSNSGGPVLEKVLKQLSIVKNESVVLEYGVGKGIAVITLSKYFGRIIGVDLSSELIDAATRNLAKMNIRNAQLYCEDARTFVTGIDDVTHIYMFNPFSRDVTSRVLSNIRQSLKRNSRTVTLILKAPYQHELFVNAGFKHSRDLYFTRQHTVQNRFSIYEIDRSIFDHAQYN